MKKIYKTTLILLLTLLIMVISLVFYLENAIDWAMSEKYQKILFTEIENTEKLPTLFYQTMDKYLPEMNQQTMWGTVYDRIIGNGTSCWCRQIYIPHFIDKKIYLSDWIVAFELEDRFSQQKCLDYLFSQEYFDFDIIGVKKASQFYFKKGLEELNEREILELYIIQQLPSHYNPLLHPEKLDERLKEIMGHIDK